MDFCRTALLVVVAAVLLLVSSTRAQNATVDFFRCTTATCDTSTCEVARFAEGTCTLRPPLAMSIRCLPHRLCAEAQLFADGWCRGVVETMSIPCAKCFTVGGAMYNLHCDAVNHTTALRTGCNEACTHCDRQLDDVPLSMCDGSLGGGLYWAVGVLRDCTVAVSSIFGSESCDEKPLSETSSESYMCNGHSKVRVTCNRFPPSPPFTYPPVVTPTVPTTTQTPPLPLNITECESQRCSRGCMTRRDAAPLRCLRVSTPEGRSVGAVFECGREEQRCYRATLFGDSRCRNMTATLAAVCGSCVPVPHQPNKSMVVACSGPNLQWSLCDAACSVCAPPQELSSQVCASSGEVLHAVLHDVNFSCYAVSKKVFSSTDCFPSTYEMTQLLASDACSFRSVVHCPITTPPSSTLPPLPTSTPLVTVPPSPVIISHEQCDDNLCSVRCNTSSVVAGQCYPYEAEEENLKFRRVSHCLYGLRTCLAVAYYTDSDCEQLWSEETLECNQWQQQIRRHPAWHKHLFRCDDPKNVSVLYEGEDGHTGTVPLPAEECVLVEAALPLYALRGSVVPCYSLQHSLFAHNDSSCSGAVLGSAFVAQGSCSHEEMFLCPSRGATESALTTSTPVPSTTVPPWSTVAPTTAAPSGAVWFNVTFNDSFRCCGAFEASLRTFFGGARGDAMEMVPLAVTATTLAFYFVGVQPESSESAFEAATQATLVKDFNITRRDKMADDLPSGVWPNRGFPLIITATLRPNVSVASLSLNVITFFRDVNLSIDVRSATERLGVAIVTFVMRGPRSCPQSQCLVGIGSPSRSLLHISNITSQETLEESEQQPSLWLLLFVSLIAVVVCVVALSRRLRRTLWVRHGSETGNLQDVACASEDIPMTQQAEEVRGYQSVA